MYVDSEIDPCEVCTEANAQTLFSNSDGIHQKCPRCGEFKLTPSASSTVRQSLKKYQRTLLSGWIRNQNRLGSVPEITTKNLEKISNSQPPTVAERAHLLLQEAESLLARLGDYFNISEARFLSASYSDSMEDVIYLLQMLSDQGFTKTVAIPVTYQITPAGHAYLEDIRAKPSTSSNGFVAMSFHEDLRETYSNGFQLGVLNAGYNPIRMDKLEHINRIDDEIIKQINQSKFLIADFTGHRSGVYFEAGYAMGIGLPVFWTCQKNDMDELHFDIRQFNCIDWENIEDLVTRLQSRIEAVLGKGSG